MGGMEILKKTALHAVIAGISLPLTVVNTSTMLLDSDFSRCRVSRVHLHLRSRPTN